MTSATFRMAARLSDLRDGMGQVITLDGREIALFRNGERVWAADARCPHAGGPLADGILCGSVVTCPLHLRAVNLDTGAVDDWPEPVRTYPVAVEAGAVWVTFD